MKISPIILFFIILLSGEILAILLYFILSKVINENTTRVSGLGIFKGMLERSFLFVSLVNGFPQALIVFGTLKIATRFKKESKISNDYFLIGNLISILLGVGYYMIWQQLN